MGLSPTFLQLAHECQRHANWYRNATQGHPVLGQFNAPTDVVGVLAASARPIAERAAVLTALVRAQRSSPHPVWHAILVLAFAPMLRRLRSTVRGVSGRELDQEILVHFLGAIARLGVDDDRPAMHLRQFTERALYRQLNRETAYHERNCGSNRLASLTTEPPDPHPEVTLPKDPILGASLTAMDRGELWALVRQHHPDASPPEITRTYRRIQRRRHRFLHALRSRTSHPKHPAPPAAERTCA